MNPATVSQQGPSAFAPPGHRPGRAAARAVLRLAARPRRLRDRDAAPVPGPCSSTAPPTRPTRPPTSRPRPPPCRTPCWSPCPAPGTGSWPTPPAPGCLLAAATAFIQAGLLHCRIGPYLDQARGLRRRGPRHTRAGRAARGSTRPRRGGHGCRPYLSRWIRFIAPHGSYR